MSSLWTGREETLGDEERPVPTIQEAIIMEFGSSSPMVNIAWCESRNRKFNSDGEVLRGKIDNDDVGLYQINTRYHLEEAKKLGYDIFTLEGNIKFARWLYDKEGVRPWSASGHCQSST